jgi:formate dehydrogenase major subunit
MATKTFVDLTSIIPQNAEDLRSRVGMLPNVASERTKGLRGRISGAKAVTSLCGYCAVGCSTLAYVNEDGTLLDVEGNPDSPINAGHLCPKGSALFGLTVNDARWTTVKYRAPYSDRYEEKPLAWALERIAQHIKKTRDETFQRERDGKRVNHTLGIATLGGATFGIEENYMLGKLTHSLGIVAIDNQARI